MICLTVRRKGSTSSGWYSPPKGTHSGEKHRAVGSGKAGGAPVVDPKLRAAIVDTVDEVKVVDEYGYADPMGSTGYFIRADGMLVDNTAVGEILFGEGNEPVEHAWVLSNHPELLGISREQIRALPLGAPGRARYNKLLHSENIVRVFGTPKVIAIDGIPFTRRGIDTIQKYMLVGKKLPVSNTAEYVWEPSDATESISFSYSDLMAAKYPRDLKDTADEHPKILIRLLVPA